METGVRWDVALGPHLLTPVLIQSHPEGLRGGVQRDGQTATGLGGRDGGGHRSLESHSLGLCLEGNTDPLKGFKLLSAMVTRTFRQRDQAAACERLGGSIRPGAHAAGGHHLLRPGTSQSQTHTGRCLGSSHKKAAHFCHLLQEALQRQRQR